MSETAMTEQKQHSTPRADVLAEEYRGTYLWEQLDKAKTQVAELEEQLQTSEARLVEYEQRLGMGVISKDNELARLKEQLEAAQQALRDALEGVTALDYEEGSRLDRIAAKLDAVLYPAIERHDLQNIEAKTVGNAAWASKDVYPAKRSGTEISGSLVRQCPDHGAYIGTVCGGCAAGLPASDPASERGTNEHPSREP